MQRYSTLFLSTWVACSSFAWGAIDHLIEITPTAGGNFHINKSGYDDNSEIALGLRLGVRATQNSLVEFGWEHIPSAHFVDNGKHNNNRYFSNYVHEFPFGSFLAPYALAGFGFERLGIEANGMNHDAFAQFGVGTRFITSKWLHLKVEVRDVIIFDGRNDLVASVGLSIPLGTAPKNQPAQVAYNDAPASPLAPQPAPSRAVTPSAAPDSMRLAPAQSVGAVGQKHQGEGFMEPQKAAPAVAAPVSPRVGEIIDTDDGQHQVTKAITLNTPEVRFAFDSYDIASVFEPQIQEFSEELLHSPTARALLEGHTDWIGTDAYNLTLSRNRANAVKSKMMEFGVDESRIGVRAYGKSRPIADNTTSAGRAQNRRVELIIIEPVAK